MYLNKFINLVSTSISVNIMRIYYPYFSATSAIIWVIKEVFGIVTIYAMTKSIRSILSPFLTISYVFGLKIIEIPTCCQTSCLSLLYILLFWSVYYLLFKYTVMPYISIYTNITVYRICLYLDFFTILLSIIVGAYYNKKFKNCLKKLTIVENTLEKLGIITDYHKLHMKIIWFVLSWIIIVTLITFVEALWLQDECDYDITTSVYIVYMINFCSHLNFISNLIFMSILGYIKLKFDQVNKYLQNLTRDKHEIKRAWKTPMLHSHQYISSKIANDELLIWILMHLHLDLCKISREVDTIFGTGMTMSIACYFCWSAHSFYEIFNIIFINNYANNTLLYATLILIWFFYFIFKLLYINYTCEETSSKANATRILINKISYSNYDVDHKNISQFLLQITQAPLHFCGLGLFQFGYKVFHDFFQYAAAVLVILIQMHMSK